LLFERRIAACRSVFQAAPAAIQRSMVRVRTSIKAVSPRVMTSRAVGDRLSSKVGSSPLGDGSEGGPTQFFLDDRPAAPCERIGHYQWPCTHSPSSILIHLRY
jgi:hypothetical protein